MDVAYDRRRLFENKNENYLLELELHSLEFQFRAELLTQILSYNKPSHSLINYIHNYFVDFKFQYDFVSYISSR